MRRILATRDRRYNTFDCPVARFGLYFVSANVAEDDPPREAPNALSSPATHACDPAPVQMRRPRADSPNNEAYTGIRCRHLVLSIGGEMAKRTGQREHAVTGPGATAPAGFRCGNPECPLSPQSLEAGPDALLRLRDEFLRAAEGIDAVVRGLDGGTAEGARPADHPPSVRDAAVETQGAGFGRLLDFQERVAGLPGVVRVSISAVDSERATLFVQFDELAR